MKKQINFTTLNKTLKGLEEIEQFNQSEINSQYLNTEDIQEWFELINKIKEQVERLTFVKLDKGAIN